MNLRFIKSVDIGRPFFKKYVLMYVGKFNQKLVKNIDFSNQRSYYETKSYIYHFKKILENHQKKLYIV